jgi:hypothetical protein
MGEANMGIREDDVLKLVEEALLVLPAAQRDEFRGQAWVLASQLDPTTPRDTRLLKTRRHVENAARRQTRRERRQVSLEQVADPAAPIINTDAADELRELVAMLAPTDRAIIAAMLAGNTQADAAGAVGLSPGAVSKRLTAIKKRFAQ